MWDPVAYRIKYITHPHVGDKWCIYPSYDFQHCLVDSLENIDYSLCTLEFEVRRESYYWLVDQLGVWRAYVWEFGRLNLTNTVMSKRKLKYMVMNHIVHGWDDPRMPTIKGLRRRGYTADAINNFCADISVTRTTMTTIDWSRLEHFLRDDLDSKAPRAFAVLHPVKLVITNKPEDFFTRVQAPLFPKDPSKGMRELPYQRVVYVDREDVKVADEPKFLGFAPGKIISLKYADVLRCDKVLTDAAGEIIEVQCTALSKEEADDAMANKKRKLGSMHWVAGSKLNEEPTRAEIRLYDHLFFEEDPSVLDDWISHINQKSEIVLQDAMIEESLIHKKVEDHVQFERLGYFVVDKDSANRSKIVYNRSCALKSN
jgi:glutaminyl-tRNA synthetase